MAELLLKIGTGGRYADGDIICAFNDRRILACHAQEITHVRHAGFTREGLRPASLAMDAMALSYRYRFQRLSRREIVRIDRDGNEERFSDRPRWFEGQWRHIHVQQYLARRLRHPRHRIFGTRGREVWFGGRLDQSRPVILKLWDLIEGRTPHRRELCSRWPFSAYERFAFVIVQCPDFSDEARGQLEANRGRYFVPYRDLSSEISLADIQDRARRAA